ncbi:carboxynorspermidine decarboxylase, partial [Campylobacter coli]
DQIHYTIVKNTTFNGIRLPNLMLLNAKNELQMIREFSYKDYALRN